MLRYKVVPALSEDIKVNYEAVIHKLEKTFEIFGSRFPELRDLQKAIEKIPLLTDIPNPYINRLISIYDITKERSFESYVIRHINHKLSKDVEFLFQGPVVIDVDALYLEFAD